MGSPTLFILMPMILGFTSGVHGQMIHASQNPARLDSNITLSSTFVVTLGSWTFDSDILVIVYPGGANISAAWQDRVEYNPATSALTLRFVQLNDSGEYRLQQFNGHPARLQLEVQAPISAVMVNDAGALAIHTKSFTLTCEVNGLFHQVVWWKDGDVISADNTTGFGTDNKTMTLNPVQLSDGGDYQCWAANAVSNMTSGSYRLMVNYGPMTPEIEGPTSALTGTIVKLNCSSDSQPPSQHSWYFNNTLVSQGSVYFIGPLTANMSGEYTCMASNIVTGKNSSTTTMLHVFEPVTMVSVVGSDPVLNQTFSLTCDARGTVHSITWSYQGMPLYPGGNKNLSMDNAILTFDPVMRSDNGNYRCEASNPHSRRASDNFTLTVSYGPEMATIMGPSVAKAGENITLTCMAASHPPSQYQWFYNNSQVATTPKHVILGSTTDMSGNYTCVASNHVTGLNSSAHWTLVVYESITVVRVASTIPAVEDASHQLKCEVTGFAEQVTWMKEGKPLTADNRTVFHMRTVTFDPLHRNDSGNYKCGAMNPYENKTSASYKLTVNYGPDLPMIYGPSYAETGQSVVFNCLASSYPQSEFSWWFNSSQIGRSPTITFDRVFLNMSGEYTCMASNNVTGKNNTSIKTLSVIETIQSVLVRNSGPPIDQQAFSLTCVVDGPFEDIYWMKDNLSLGMNDSNLQVSNGTDNSTIHFRPLKLRHDGEYQCVAANKVRTYKSPSFELLANYGPLNISITGPDTGKDGTTVTLTCSVDSRPDSHFKWLLPNPLLSINNMPTLSFTATKSIEGTFTCEARNPVSNVTARATKTFTLSGVASAFQLTSQNLVILTVLLSSCLTLMLP
ncbi:carcinoembryonic antigen-related cell adhesion molecule 1 [Synchiropus picturatus]